MASTRCANQAPERLAATLAVVNARVWTGTGTPGAEGVVVCGDRVALVGSAAEVRRRVNRHTEVLDAGGGLVLPGFNDAHVHFLPGGISLQSASLREAADAGAFAAAVAALASDLPPGVWIRSGQWDHEAWPEGRRPSRALLDAGTPRNPLFLRRIDGHMGVANSLALHLAGISAETQDPPGGSLERDPATGELTGILVDSAMDLVTRHLPECTREECLQATLAASRHAASLGVTSVQSSGDVAEMQALRELHQRGQLITRVCMLLPPDQRRGLGPAGQGPEQPDMMVRCGGVKLFADGSLGARSALFFEPYDDDPDTCGLAMQSEEELSRWVAELDAAGHQVALHAIGDKAVHWGLNAFEHAAAARPGRDARHRLEHAQAVRPEDRLRFARLGVIASIQPYHCSDDLRWVGKRLGARAAYAYPYRSLVQARARMALGTDWPVEPLNPMLALYAAVTRQTVAGEPAGGWQPQERVDLEQALRDHTRGSAVAEFAETAKGTLAPGQLADMAVLSQDILQAPPQELLSTAVMATIVGGRVVHQA